MSAKDDLDRFDREWAGHVDWRNGKSRGFSTADGGADKRSPGKYVSAPDRAYGVSASIALPEMPDRLRKEMLAELDTILHVAIDKKKIEIRAQLIALAKEEAHRTLEEIES